MQKMRFFETNKSALTVKLTTKGVIYIEKIVR